MIGLEVIGLEVIGLEVIELEVIGVEINWLEMIGSHLVKEKERIILLCLKLNSKNIFQKLYSILGYALKTC